MTKAVFIPGQEALLDVPPQAAASEAAVAAAAELTAADIQRPAPGYDGVDPRDEHRAETLRETLGWNPERVERTITGIGEQSVAVRPSDPRLQHARPAPRRRHPQRELRHGDEAGTNFPDGRPAEHQPRVLFDGESLARFRGGIALVQQVLDDKGIGRNS